MSFERVPPQPLAAADVSWAIAYASARMEPVFCALGESAGVAAAQAVRASVAVQAIDVAQLQWRLLERGQMLDWPP